jgi:hypothetical protein
MGSYADATTVKQRSGVDADDLGLTDSELDALLADLNSQASESIEDYCQRDFEQHTDDTAALDGNGRDAIRLPGYPVTSIASVEVGENNPTTLDADDYRVRDDPAFPGENGGVLERRRAVWPRGWENVQVTYTWGYSSPPGAVERVADDLVIEALQAAAKDTKGKGATSLSLDGFSVSFPDGGLRMDLDESQRATLDDHKRVVVA